MFDSVNVPAPDLVIVPAPETIPLIVPLILFVSKLSLVLALEVAKLLVTL